MSIRPAPGLYGRWMNVMKWPMYIFFACALAGSVMTYREFYNYDLMIQGEEHLCDLLQEEVFRKKNGTEAEQALIELRVRKAVSRPQTEAEQALAELRARKAMSRPQSDAERLLSELEAKEALSSQPMSDAERILAELEAEGCWKQLNTLLIGKNSGFWSKLPRLGPWPNLTMFFMGVWFVFLLVMGFSALIHYVWAGKKP